MRGNGRGWRWLAAGLALMYVVCAALLGRQAADRLARAREQSDSTTALAAVEARPTLRAEPPEMFGRGEALLEENPDLVGMVGYGERAMYVCRGTDNRWYSNHRFDGSEDPAGMIYMDCRCQP